jgi:hypothetical protein
MVVRGGACWRRMLARGGGARWWRRCWAPDLAGDRDSAASSSTELPSRPLTRLRCPEPWRAKPLQASLVRWTPTHTRSTPPACLARASSSWRACGRCAPTRPRRPTSRPASWRVRGVGVDPGMQRAVVGLAGFACDRLPCCTSTPGLQRG